MVSLHLWLWHYLYRQTLFNKHLVSVAAVGQWQVVHVSTRAAHRIVYNRIRR